MKIEVVVFDTDYWDIPLQDLPDAGHFVICKDSQYKLKPGEWAVVRAIGEDGSHLPRPLGLFWDKDEAVFYANAKADNSNTIREGWGKKQ